VQGARRLLGLGLQGGSPAFGGPSRDGRGRWRTGTGGGLRRAGCEGGAVGAPGMGVGEREGVIRRRREEPAVEGKKKVLRQAMRRRQEEEYDNVLWAMAHYARCACALHSCRCKHASGD
jgi:hypothetical protein